MAEEIKYVEEAPESQPSVREKLAWVLWFQIQVALPLTEMDRWLKVV